MTPLVITGLGAITPAGLGRAALAEWLASGSDRRRPVDVGAGWHRRHRTPHALLLDDLDLSTLIQPQTARRMSPPARYAVATARLTLADGGVDPGDPQLETMAIALATAFGPSSFTEKLLRGILVEGPEAASPALFTECVANAPAAQVALALRARGPNVTITQREVGGLLAVQAAARELHLGRAPWAIAGVVEEITPLLHAILERFGALANGVARPFDRRRDGVVASEGAAVWLIEPAEHASRRRAPPIARLRVVGSAFDPTATVSGHGTGAVALADSIERSLRAADISLGQIDQIVSGGSGSRTGDRLEAELLAALFRQKSVPPVLAPKRIVGEYGGGFLGSALLLASGAPLAAPTGWERDELVGIVPQGSGTSRPPTMTMVTCLAVGGAAAWMVLERA